MFLLPVDGLAGMITVGMRDQRVVYRTLARLQLAGTVAWSVGVCSNARR